MNVVFLSPHFPPHYYNFCRQLKAAGAHVLGIADAPYDSLSDDLRAALTDLGREMALRVYGQGGQPYVAFPCSRGRYFDLP